jgi:hexulose-6-phosphate isomerase
MKEQEIERRSFLKYAATTTISAGLLGCATTPRTATEVAGRGARLRKALQFGMLPKDLADADKFKLARDCGFEGIEGSPMKDLDAAKRLGELARNAGTPIHSIVFGGWHAPFSSGDPKVIEKGLAGMENALRSAKALGADTVLLVPAVLNEEVGYGQAYERSQKHIRKLLPLAEELKVVIAVENVWNKFLLSPLEFARYVDEFESPWLQAYFDVGNVILFGYAQDWIRTLGKRIVKIHLKDQWIPDTRTPRRRSGLPDGPVRAHRQDSCDVAAPCHGSRQFADNLRLRLAASEVTRLIARWACRRQSSVMQTVHLSHGRSIGTRHATPLGRQGRRPDGFSYTSASESPCRLDGPAQSQAGKEPHFFRRKHLTLCESPPYLGARAEISTPLKAADVP